MLAVNLSTHIKSQVERRQLVLNVNSCQCQLDVSRYFKISQSFFSTGGTTCLSDYCCCGTASTRAGEPEKPILSGGRWLFDETAWNSMRSSCSPWETDKSVVLLVLPLVHFGSFWFILVPPRMRYSNWKTKSLKSRRFLPLSGGFYLLKLAS